MKNLILINLVFVFAVINSMEEKTPGSEKEEQRPKKMVGSLKSMVLIKVAQYIYEGKIDKNKAFVLLPRELHEPLTELVQMIQSKQSEQRMKPIKENLRLAYDLLPIALQKIADLGTKILFGQLSPTDLDKLLIKDAKEGKIDTIRVLLGSEL